VGFEYLFTKFELFIYIKLIKYCKEQDIEACALKLEYTFFNICVISAYRAPSGYFSLFLNGLDRILNSLYKVDLKFIICGDININYLTCSEETRQFDAMLLCYNLPSIVNFPTRTQNKSSTAIDNIFIDTYKITDCTFFPLISGLSDHDSELLIIMDLKLQVQDYLIHNIRSINKYSIE
jgi:exonuclease III